MEQDLQAWKQCKVILPFSLFTKLAAAAPVTKLLVHIQANIHIQDANNNVFSCIHMSLYSLYRSSPASKFHYTSAVLLLCVEMLWLQP